jgi:hypothetical protein
MAENMQGFQTQRPPDPPVVDRGPQGINADAQLPPAPKSIEQPRRFYLPDIDRHGNWLFSRMVQAFPHFNERTAFTYLRGIVQSSNNEWLVLYLTHGVALAQLVHFALVPAPVIQVHFVWVADPSNREWQTEALEFYEEIKRWAARMRLETIVGLTNKSDVPISLIASRFERVLEYKQLIGKVLPPK